MKLALLTLALAGCYPGGLLPAAPAAPVTKPCLIMACRTDEGRDCELLTCERALPLMETRLCAMHGECEET